VSRAKTDEAIELSCREADSCVPKESAVKWDAKIFTGSDTFVTERHVRNTTDSPL